MNLASDLGLILIYEPTGKINADQLVRFARDHGFRGTGLISKDQDQHAAFQAACQKYTEKQVTAVGQQLPQSEVIETILANRRQGKNSIFQVTLTKEGSISAADQPAFSQLNQWLHDYGHAFYEGKPGAMKTNQPNFVLVNRHAPYQTYLFLKKVLPGTISVTNLPAAIEKAEWIADRKPVAFQQTEQAAEIQVKQGQTASWRVMRLLLHRSEDDIPKTKY